MENVNNILVSFAKFKGPIETKLIQTEKMPINNIVLLYSNRRGNESMLSKYFGDEDCCWTYLGPDYLNYLKIEKYVDNKLQYIEISERLDNISNIIRDDFQSYIDNLNLSNKDSFEWWFTPLSSRNVYMNGTFQNVCFVELLKNLCRELNYKKLIIVAENYSIGHSIESHADYLKISISCIGKPITIPHQGILIGFFWIGKCLFKAGLNYIFAKLSVLGTRIKPKERYSRILGNTCLIDVFVYEKNFSDDGGFADRYLPGLESFLIENGYSVVYYPTFTETNLNKYSLYSKVRANDRIFLIAQDFLRITDYIKSAMLAVKSVCLSVDAPLFRGIDINLIDSSDNKWFCYENIFKAYLQYFTFLRLSVTFGDKFERIISWHENQLQNKALCKAVHETFNGCKIVGSHAYIHYLNEIYLYPLDSESVCGYAPDVLLSSGPIVSRYLKRYMKNIPITPSVPLRQSYLNIDRSKNLTSVKLLHDRDILIMLPYNIVQCIELLSRVFQSLDNIIDKIYVRCHPDYDERAILRILSDIPHAAEIIFVNDKNLSDLFLQGYVIVSVASGTIIDAIAYGNPTIIIASNNAVSISPIDKSNSSKCDSIITCYDDQSLCSAVKKLRKLPMHEITSGDSMIYEYIYSEKENYLSPYLK